MSGPLMDAVMTYLEGAPGATCSQIAAALQHDPSRIRESLNRLYARGLVGRQPGLFDNQWRWFSAQTTARPPTASPVIGASTGPAPEGE